MSKPKPFIIILWSFFLFIGVIGYREACDGSGVQSGESRVGISSQRSTAAVESTGGGGVDILYRNPDTGRIGVWFMNGLSEASWSPIKDPSGNPAVHDAAWKIKGAGDFNGDGHNDVVFAHSNGNVGVWLMDGVNETSWRPLTDKDGGRPANHGSWEIKGVGDFNNDGRNDLLYRHPDTAKIGVWLMNGTIETSWVLIQGLSGDPANHGADWDIRGVGDFNRDGHRDILYRHSGGAIGVWLMEGVKETSWAPLTDADGGRPANHGSAWDIKGVGDFNNDSRLDILYRNAVTGNIGVWLMDGVTETAWHYINNHGVWNIGAAGGFSLTQTTDAYYVSPNGSDANDGRSLAGPFKTLAKAISVVVPGETIFLLPGVYPEAITMQNLGNTNNAITITGLDGGNPPLLDGQRDKTMGIWGEGCANLVFSDLALANYTDLGLGISQSNNISFQNLVVYDCGFAVQLIEWEFEGYGLFIENTSNTVIENCDTYRNGPNPQTATLLMGTGINMYGCSNSTIRDNKSHNNIGGGILVEDSTFILVENNTVTDNDLDASSDGWWDGGIWLDGGHDVTIRNNRFTGNLGPGIEISDEDLQNPYNYILENNTSTGNYYGIFIWNFGVSDWPPSNIIQQTNNTFTGNSRRNVVIVPWESTP